jgi:hypothetical protein
MLTPLDFNPPDTETLTARGLRTAAGLLQILPGHLLVRRGWHETEGRAIASLQYRNIWSRNNRTPPPENKSQIFHVRQVRILQ